MFALRILDCFERFYLMHYLERSISGRVFVFLLLQRMKSSKFVAL